MKPIEREIETVGTMIDLYCRHHHGNGGRCQNCRELYLYARERLLKCPFGEKKPACGSCRIHCYRPEMRARIREVMKFAGPRMVYSHPILAFWHLRMARRKQPSGVKERA
ncbi:MAG: nitrous oxide-stimulated promoter family protein [Deltaproteobacteria bacterium]|nr:nitrous oxide-stimulated promoter family protein [Deltaproteobacteria bacterium]